MIIGLGFTFLGSHSASNFLESVGKVAKNSWFFYFASFVNKQLRDVSQLNELLNKKEYSFTIKIGKPIKHTDLSSHNDIAIQQLRYKSESLKKGFFKLKRFLYLRQYKN